MPENKENRFLKVEKTARLTWIKDAKKKNSHLLIALHGYGQLSTYFSRKFEGLEQLDYDVLIPEGLHRFYLQGSSGRVGASWMTKEEREFDIEDNQNYLHSICEKYGDDYEKIVLLGFSQGGATAARYYCDNKDFFKGMILWANVFPPDIDPLKGYFEGEHEYFVLGNEDPYFPIEKQKEVLTLHSELGLNVVSFEGKHDIDKQTLHSILVNI